MGQRPEQRGRGDGRRKPIAQSSFVAQQPARVIQTPFPPDDRSVGYELSVAVGDEVIYGKYGGTDIEVNGEEVKILRESDILAKVVE